ncbi:hypothetical protein B0A55_04213 [Friedmanniomyces simplex]|uniref:XPG-I domain-containing protein n=1 Tax=Friedmanniomyces simplex TaxID=329884 RepID=A0A4U0XWG6_9PEZI|nr:hypothetical protein B0A55_04213 [Friedmanniomyces simplex]
MGIHGLLKELTPPPRHSLAALAATHYTTHSRPLLLAIDTAIWLFQIQSGRGGSNPALRTFYYRLLRLLSLGIHPLFVFDGPNKPLFKRNKKVGGPGVRVASVPEFLAKQLLKQFGFPWHVAPGEAEAECALLQREGIVDAVLSEDVDTLMFGSRLTFRDWRAEGPMGGSKKTPTHVSVYREAETKERSRGMEREGMILVALMSGGDYLPEGIPGCGPKVACDAARAGFGAELCTLKGNDTAGLRGWKERLQHEIRTNESKFFSRRNNGFTMPEGFPNKEVLGYYTHPCVSTAEKLARLRTGLRWDQAIDFPALRTFAADAFDWRCLGGAKKFIKNLAPALLMRELRRQGDEDGDSDESDRSGGGTDAREREREQKRLVQAIHGKRNHATVDMELEYRISFTPAHLVPIDLSQEEEDDEFIPAGGVIEAETDTESDFASIPPSSAATAVADDDEEEDEEEPAKKKRTPKPFDPEQPDKIWVLKTFVQVGCPGLVEEYEASLRDPKAFFKQRRQVKAAAAGEGTKIHAKKAVRKTAVAEVKSGKGAGRQKKKKQDEIDGGRTENTLTRYTKVTKSGVEREPLKEQTSSQENSQTLHKPSSLAGGAVFNDGDLTVVSGFKMPSTQVPAAVLKRIAREVEEEEEDARRRQGEYEVLDLSGSTPRATRPQSGSGVFAAFAAARKGDAISASTIITTGGKPPGSEDSDSDILDLTATPRAYAPLSRRTASNLLPASTAPAAVAAVVATETKTKTKTWIQPKARATQQPQQKLEAWKTPPRRKRPSQELSSPALPSASSQRTITAYYSPSPRKPRQLLDREVVNLISSSPAKPQDAGIKARARSQTPTPPNLRTKFVRSPSPVLPAVAFHRLDGADDRETLVDFSPGKLPETVTKRRRKGGLRRWQTAPVRGADDTNDLDEVRNGDMDVGGDAGGALEAMDLACSPSPSPVRFSGGAGGFLVDDDEMGQEEQEENEEEDPSSPSTLIIGRERSRENNSTPAVSNPFDRRPRSGPRELSSSYPTPPPTANANTPAVPKQPAPASKKSKSKSNLTNPAAPPLHSSAPKPPLSTHPPAPPLPRRSPRQPQPLKEKKKAFLLRQSLEGAWKEVDAETLDLSGDGSGWKVSGGRAAMRGFFRESGVEVLDMTGA